MIVPGPATRIFLAPGPTDLRRSFDGLHGLVLAQLQEDPRSGHLFLFCNRLRPQTTFCIPFRHGCDCLPMASPAGTAIARNASQGAARQ